MHQYNQVNEYITEICNQIRSRRAHQAISKEIIDHIEDQKNAFVLDGQDEETAVNNAIKEMGDPIVVGEQLDKIHRPKPEKSIIATVIVLVILHLASISFTMHLKFEYLLSIIIGISIMILVYFIDYSWIVKYSTLIYILLAFFNVFLDNSPIRIISRSVSLDYYFSLLLIVAYSGVIINFRNKGYKGYIICILLFVVGVITMIINESVLSCLVIFCIGMGTLFFIACLKNVFRINKKVTINLFIIVITLFAIFVLFRILTMYGKGYYNFDRLVYTINPDGIAEGVGYERVLVREVLSNSKFLGGYIMPETFNGNSLEILFPNLFTDYQLLRLISIYGYVVGIFIILVISFLIIRMFMSTFKQKNQQGMFISLGCSIVILIQSVFYILSNLGYGLVGIISLPLLSYGKASFIVNMIIIGIMLCTYRNDSLVERR